MNATLICDDKGGSAAAAAATTEEVKMMNMRDMDGMREIMIGRLKLVGAKVFEGASLNWVMQGGASGGEGGSKADKQRRSLAQAKGCKQFDSFWLPSYIVETGKWTLNFTGELTRF